MHFLAILFITNSLDFNTHNPHTLKSKAVSQFQERKGRTCILVERLILPGDLERTNSEGHEDTKCIFVRIEMCCELVAQLTVPEYYK